MRPLLFSVNASAIVTSLLCLRDAGRAQHGIVAQMFAHGCASRILAAHTHTQGHRGTDSVPL